MLMSLRFYGKVSRYDLDMTVNFTEKTTTIDADDVSRIIFLELLRLLKEKATGKYKIVNNVNCYVDYVFSSGDDVYLYGINIEKGKIIEEKLYKKIKDEFLALFHKDILEDGVYYQVTHLLYEKPIHNLSQLPKKEKEDVIGFFENLIVEEIIRCGEQTIKFSSKNPDLHIKEENFRISLGEHNDS